MSDLDIDREKLAEEAGKKVSNQELAEAVKEMKKISERFTFSDDIKFPCEISGLKFLKPRGSLFSSSAECGDLTAIRPCKKEYENKTYLGIYLGNLPVGYNYALENETKIINVYQDTNPAIYIPELKKIIYGYESWWHVIENEDQLKQITNEDIEKIPYVQILRSLKKREEKKKNE